MLTSNEALQKCFHELSHTAYLLQHVKVVHNEQNANDEEFNIAINRNCAPESHNALKQIHIATQHKNDYSSTIAIGDYVKRDVNNRSDYCSKSEKCEEERSKHLPTEQLQCEHPQHAEQSEQIQKIFACQSNLFMTRNSELIHNTLYELREQTAALKKICLPKILKSNTVKSLENLGTVINAIQKELEEHVSRQLVDFYNYMTNKESAEIHEILEHRQIAPMGFEGFSWSSSSMHNGKIEEKEENTRRSTSDTSFNQQFTTGRVDNYDLHCEESNKTKKIKDLEFQLHRDISNSVINNNSKGVNATAKENVVVARDNAQHALRSFVYFLLECVMKETNASRGAVYICTNAREMQKSGMALATSILSNSPTSGKKDNAASLSETNLGPRFIERVAEIRCQNALPERVSFASATTLTTAIVNNIAVNLTCNELRARNALHREEDKYKSNIKNVHSVEYGSSSLSQEHSKNLQERWSQINVHTALIFPICNFGCLVVADKRKDNAYNKFNTIDEHVTWSTAKLFSTLLSRYEPSLFLLKNSDNNKVKVRNLWHSVQELAVDKDKNKELTKNEWQESSIANIGVYNEGCYCERATIIRTSNAKLENYCAENYNNNTHENRENIQNFKECTEINPNEVFQEGAEYIHNLESLWTRSISENQMLKQIIDEQANEIHIRDERINDLVSKVKNLNVQVAHLQRNATACRM